MLKVGLTAVAIGAAVLTAAAERIVLPERTALFSGPSFTSERLGHCSGAAEALEPLRTHYTEFHPLAAGNRFRRVRLPDGRSGYVSPEITVDTSGELCAERPFPLFEYLAAVAAAVLLVAAAWRHIDSRRSGKLLPGSGCEALFFITEALALRYMLSFLALAGFPGVIPAAADDHGYFEVGYDLWHFSFGRPWRFTIGNGLLYLPFIALSRAREFYDIAQMADRFTLFVTAPLALVLAFQILRKLRIPTGAAAAALFTGALWPFVACHLENWRLAEFPAFFGWPVPGPTESWGAWRFYRFAIGAGFNAMSDMPGMCALLAAILAALSFPLDKRHAALGAAIWGFACLIRINYCLFLPLFAFICWRRAAAERLPLRRTAELLLCGIAGFFAVFGWQMLVNCRDFGSVFRFGYVLHYPDFPAGQRPADGFTLRTLLEWRNLKFLFGANRAAWTLFFTGAWFMRDRELRSTFVLWAAPLTIFFLGYYQTYCDSARFILPAFVACFGAFWALECWRESPAAPRLAALGALWAAILLGSSAPLFAVCGAAAAAAAFLLYRSGNVRAAAAVLFALGYFAVNSAFLGGALLLLALGRAAWDIFATIRRDRVENLSAGC